MVDGVVETGWGAVRKAFEGVAGSGLDDGASLAVYRDGELIVDLWAGTDPLSGRPWQRDSVTLGFSITKGAAAICLLRLVDRAQVGLDEPVARYWPEFGQNGKEAVTVRDVLTHRSALPMIDLDPITDVVDWTATTDALARQPLQYAPGEYVVYHALSFGFLVGELVRRVSGLPIGEYFANHVAGPLGLDFWIGQPASVEPRYLPALTTPVVSPTEPLSLLGEAAGVCRAAFESNRQLTPLFERVDGVQGSEPFNALRFRGAAIPAGNGVANARSLARMYAACMRPVDGVQLLSEGILAEAARNQAGGARIPDCADGSPGAAEGEAATWGLGFEISHAPNPMLGESSFGHSGMGGRLGFGHRESGISFGYVSQRMAYPAPGTLDPRWEPLLDAVRVSAGL